MLPFSEACERNKEPILGVLRTVFAGRRQVLEIGSGTGQHAVYFAAALPHLTWHPTERLPGLPDLGSRIAQQPLPNLRAPTLLDVRQQLWPLARVDAVFSANTLHIMSWEEVIALFDGLNKVLELEAVVAIYGPFSYRGRFSAQSNQRFDEMLRMRDPASGIRDMQEVLPLARRNGLELVHDHDLPANNRLLVLRFAG